MTYPSPGHDADDVDRLLAQLDRVPPPPELASRILGCTVAREPAPATTLAWPVVLAAFAAVVALAAAGYLIGAQLAASNGLDLLLAVASDLSLLASAPGDVVAAFAEVVPVGLLATAVISLGLLVWAAGRLVDAPPAARARAGG